MQGWLDFTPDELHALAERLADLCPRLDPTGTRVWRVQQTTDCTVYLSVHGEGRLYPVAGVAGGNRPA